MFLYYSKCGTQRYRTCVKAYSSNSLYTTPTVWTDKKTYIFTRNINPTSNENGTISGSGKMNSLLIKLKNSFAAIKHHNEHQDKSMSIWQISTRSKDVRSYVKSIHFYNNLHHTCRWRRKNICDTKISFAIMVIFLWMSIPSESYFV